MQAMVFDGDLPDSPSNSVADDLEAAVLGQRLFFDQGLSSDGTIACANCHDPSAAFSDPRIVSLGVEGREGTRHAPALVNPGTGSFFLWDGRADSLWSQALLAIENPAEMDFTRAEVAHYIASNHREAYEDVFGALPDLSEVPRRAMPGDSAWAGMSDADQVAVERVFSNAAKAIEAYERRLLCENTLFDRVMRGEASFTPNQERGASEFVRAGCIDCHAGPQLNESDDGDVFHNNGLSREDTGRFDGIPQLLASTFNSAGQYSDNPDAGFDFLDSLDATDRDVGAFKTPSLRGVAQRPRFFHDGSRTSLEDVLDFYDRPPRRQQSLGEVDRSFERLGNFNEGAMEAFLETLNCPTLPSALLETNPAWP